MKVTKAFIKAFTSNPMKELNALSTQDIARLLDAASDAYYNTSTALVPDDLFDLIKDTLAERDPTNPSLKRVGAPIRGDKVQLPYWMGSMDKIRDDPKALSKWKSKYDGEYVVSDKLDGNSAMIVHDHGSLRMYSRGDGEMGQDITHLLSSICGIPNIADIPDSMAIRGELIISRANWQKIRDLGANARNVVAGTMNAKHPKPEITSKIEFVAYEMVKPKSLPPSGCLDALASIGFTVTYREIIPVSQLTTETLSDILMRRRKDSAYECDGIVVEHNAIHKTIKGKNPAHAFAFKSILTHDEAEVIVKEVEWNTSKDGFIKPTVLFDPVTIEGAQIRRATGFNGAFIEKNVIGPGARIVIIRSGDVIPHIIRVLSPAASNRASMPETPFVWNDTHVDIMIAEDATSDQMELKKMEHFVSTLDIKNVAGGTLKKLYDAGYDTIPKLLALTVQDILKLDGFQQTSAQRIVDGFQKAKTTSTCPDMMVASNLFGRGLGKRKIAFFTDAFPTILEGKTPTLDQLSTIKGLGRTTCETFLEALPAFFKFMNDIGVPCRPLPAISKHSSPSAANAAFANATVVFTGFRNADWEKHINAAGGKVTGSISKNTTLVVAADPNETSSKLQKAREFGIKIISRTEFERMLT